MMALAPEDAAAPGGPATDQKMGSGADSTGTHAMLDKLLVVRPDVVIDAELSQRQVCTETKASAAISQGESQCKVLYSGTVRSLDQGVSPE
jgi:hypothetical protein